jgi:hypothetical protein
MPKAARRTVLLLLVAVLLALPGAVSAAGLQSPRTARAILYDPLDLFSHLWSLFRKEGCNIDPNGLCAPKNGCGIDPDGLCAPKNGCSVDPDGRCLPHGSSLATGDNGCEFDPSGRCRESQSPVQTKNGCEADPDGRCLR